MTIVFKRLRNKTTEEPSTHVLIIGVGSYPHLLGGTGKPASNLMGLEQLTSPPISAKRLADFFVSRQGDTSGKIGFWNPHAPLGTVEMLVSPSSDPKEEATRKNIETAYETWIKRVNENVQNIGIFYFCGHGVSGWNDYLLPADFGKSHNTWRDAIDITNTARAVRRVANGAFYFFIDTCREFKKEALMPGAGEASLESFYPEKPVLSFSRLMLWAVGDGMQAHARQNNVSRFTSALIQALSGFCAETLSDENIWVVTSKTLCSSIEQILEKENESLESDKQQNIEVQRIGSHPFHYETVRPERVIPTTSFSPINSCIREALEKMPNADALAPMLKESFAELVETGAISLEHVEQLIAASVRQSEVLVQRFVQQQDLEIAERAQTLLEAGKQKEAEAVFEELIKSTESRLDTYYESRAELAWMHSFYMDSTSPEDEKWIRKAAEYENPVSLYYFGLLLQEKGDHVGAYEAFREAAAYGHDRAVEMLEEYDRDDM